MSHEAHVRFLVENELEIAKATAKESERVARELYTRFAQLAGFTYSEEFLISFEQGFRDNLDTLAANIEVDDLHEIKRITALVDISCTKLQALFFVMVFHEALVIILQ